MTLFIPAALGLLALAVALLIDVERPSLTWLTPALAVALLIEDCSRRSWKRSFRTARQRIQELSPAPPVRPEYEIERAADHRGDVRHWTPPVSGIEHVRGTR